MNAGSILGRDRSTRTWPGLGILFIIALFLNACAAAGPGSPAPSFSLENQIGETTQLADFRGRPVVLTFLYTNCADTCPLYLANIRTALQNYAAIDGDAPAVVVVTVDPDRDTVDRMRYYASHWPPGWAFLTGSYRQLSPIWGAYRVSVANRPPPGSSNLGHGYTVNHTAKALVIDREGVIRTELTGTWAPQELANALTAADQPVSGLASILPATDLTWFLRRCGEFASANPAVFFALVLIISSPVLIITAYLYRSFVRQPPTA